MKKISTGTETLRVFSVDRDTTVTTVTKSGEETEEAVSHAKVLAEMVSPSEETNLTFPWFMTMHPGCGRVYFVDRSSNKSVPTTVVWTDDQVQHMVP